MWTYKIEPQLMWIYKINQHLQQISTKIILQNATNSKKSISHFKAKTESKSRWKQEIEVKDRVHIP